MQEEQPKMSKQATMDATITCGICFEPISPKNLFKSECKHRFCSNCISEYITLRISEKHGTISCPGSRCNQIYDPIMCKSIIPRKSFDEWCDTLCFETLPNIKHRCFCPHEGCKELIINECGGTRSLRKVKCPKCNNQVPWNSRGKVDVGDAMFLQLAKKKKWRSCPRCGQYVHRISGCSKVRCRCGKTFCYVCGKESALHYCIVVREEEEEPNRCGCICM